MGYKEDITKQVNHEIAKQKQALNGELQLNKFNADSTIKKNNDYLKEQVGQMHTSRIVNDDKITALQNRRGGFYSGGLDYQLAENLRNTTNAQGALRRDIASNNSDTLGQYNLLARQAAEKIRLLEQEGPIRIRELVNAELARQRSASRGGGGGSRGGSSYSSAEAVLQAALKEINDSIHVRMGNSSPKLNPDATTGLASKPGSYWYARGYGSQYLPNNYGQSKGKSQTGVR